MKKIINGKEYCFAMQLEVRDYEIDYQGIVNNANYLHYLEHTRHEFCKEAGMTFSQMHDQGLDPVLSKAELEYLSPLRMGETFISCLNIERRGPKFIFYQDIFKPDGSAVLTAKITVACLLNGVLSRGNELAEALHI